MVKAKNLLFLLLLLPILAFSQEKAHHLVLKGETVYGLAKKYNVKVTAIYELNPNSKNGLKPGTSLIIPKEVEKVENEAITHEVLPKETLYGISKKYNVSIENLKKENPFIETEGLKIGSKIIISNAKVEGNVVEKKEKTFEPAKVEMVKKEVAESNEDIYHEILPKETKYGISKKYGVSIAELEELNPSIKIDFPIGYKLLIRGGKNTVLSKNNLPEKIIQKKEEPKKEEPKKEEPKKEDPNTGNQIKIVEVKSHEQESQDVLNNDQNEKDDATEDQKPILEVPSVTADVLTKAEFLIQKASENLGARYRSGGTGNGGFDCSGLMFSTFKNLDITLPRSSASMAQSAGVKIERSQAQKGDLIFFETFGKGRVSHVGMITEVTETDIKFIHSSTSAGVIISALSEPYYTKRFFQINRVLTTVGSTVENETPSKAEEPSKGEGN